jgi:hypothetical protein
MTQLSPDVLALKHDLARATRADHDRRVRRRRRVRTTALTLGTLAALSGSALAAGDALGVIDLSGGVSATPVSTFPQLNGETWTMAPGGADAPYVYHLTGSAAAGVGCGPADPNPTNNIYITATSQLTTDQLQQLSNLVATGISANSRVIIPGVTSIRNASCPGSVFVLTPAS